MKNYPFHLVTGSGKGASYSSLRQIGDIIPAASLGQAKVRVFYNIASFNLAVADRALIFPEFREAVILGYCYNSQSSTSSAWRLPIKSFIPPDIAHAPQIIFIEADGHETTYSLYKGFSAQDTYFAPGLINGTPYLVYDDQNYQWFWYDPRTQVCERYNKYGKLIERRDAWGNLTTYAYTDPANGVLQSITGPSQIRYYIDRTPKSDGGRYEVIRVQRPGEDSGASLQLYEFDKNGLLIASSASLNGQDLSTVYQTQYVYAYYNPPLLDSIKQDDGTLLQMEFDTYSQNGALAYRLQTFYLPAAGGQTRTDFTYSSGKVKVEVRGAWMADCFIDSQYRLIQKNQYVSYYDGPEVIETTRYEYAGDGQIQKITLSNGGIESFTYSSPFGMLMQHVRPNGQQTDYVYDNGQNRPLLQSTTVNLPESKTPLISYTVYERRLNGSSNFADECDYLRYEISPQGRVVAYEPTPKGSVQFKRVYLSGLYPSRYVSIAPSFTEMEDWKDQQNPQQIMLNEYLYNSQGLQLRKIRYTTVDENGNGVRNSSMSQTDRSWNVFGHWTDQEKILECDDQDDVLSTAETHRRFDGMERMTSLIDSVDNVTLNQYSVNNDKTYERGVYALTLTQPNLRLENTILDPQGDAIYRVISVPEEDSYSSPQVTYWYRDLGGRPILITYPDGSTHYNSFYLDNNLGLSISTSGLVTEYLIDNVHNFKCEIQYKNPVDLNLLDTHSMEGAYTKSLIKTDSADRYHYRFYDNSNRLRFEVDAKNQTKETCYDTLDRITSTILYKDPLTDDQINLLKSGQLIELTPDFTKDRCTSTYYDNDNIKIGEIDPDGWVTEYIIDNGGRVSQSIRYSTPNRATTRSNDFSVMRPVANDEDAHTYFFYNARGQVIYSVNPEAFLTYTIFYASEKIFQVLRYYNKINSDWFKNPIIPPPLPAPNSEDFLTNYQYDALEREINVFSSDGTGQTIQYTNMSQICLKRRYDARKCNSNGNCDPDQTRTVQTRYDGWEHQVQFANEFICQQLAEIEADDNLTPEQKQQQIEALWQNSTLRDEYDDITGLKLKSIDTLNRTTIFYYDPERREVLRITPMGAAKQKFYSSFHEVLSRRRYYNLISTDDLDKLSGGFISDNILKLLVANDAQDIIENFEYDKLSQKIRYIDPEQYIFIYQYSRFGEIIEEQIPLDKSWILTIQHTFNNRGQEITTVRISDSGESLIYRKSYENLYGRVTQEIDEAGAITQQKYDKLSNSVLIIDALGVSSHRRTFDALQRVLTDADSENQTTGITYNQNQRTTLTQPPIAETQVEEETNIFKESVRRIDTLNETRIWKHTPLSEVAQSINELGLITQDEYDSEKQHLSHLDPIGIKTTWSYNADGYLIQQVQLKAYQNQDLITRYTRDTFGRAIFITNPRGMITQQVFNPRSLVLKKVRDYGSETQPGLRLTKAYTYNGQKTKISLVQGDEKIPNQYTVNFQQDGFNRAIGKIIDPDGDNPLAFTSRQSLDNVSRTISHTDAAGRIIRLFYDALGHKRFAIDAAGGIIEWQYNTLELKSRVRKYETGLTANELAELSDQTTLAQVESLAAGKLNPQDNLKYYFYDPNHREQFTVQLLQDPLQPNLQGIVEEKIYDGANHLIQTIQYNTSVDATDINTWTTASLAQLMASHISPDDRLTVTIVDPAGQQRFSVSPRGVINEQRFDALGRVITKLHYAKLMNPQTAASFSLAEMIDYLTANIADVSQDQADNTVFNVFDKAEYIVKTHLAPQCAITQYGHDFIGNLTGIVRYKNLITFNSYDDLLQQLAKLIANPEQGDRITSTTFDLCDRVINDTDELDYQNIYQRDALDNQVLHTDRAGFIWQRNYDRGKRLIAELTPEAPVNTVSDTDSGLTYVEKNRSVKTVYQYDGVNNLLQKTVDVDGDEPRTAAITYWIHNQQNSITVLNVEVDDPAQAASLSTRPVTKQNIITKTVFNFKLKKVVEISEQNAAEFSVYDSLGRLAYKIDKVNGVTAYTRNNFNEVLVESKYSTPLKTDLTPYRQTGISIDIVAANIIDSNDDRHAYYERDKSGNPIKTIRGIAKPTANAKPEDLTGLLFYFDPAHPASGFYYSQTDRQFDAFNNVILSSHLITPAPIENWSRTYQWFDGKGNVIANAEAVNQSLGAPLTYRVVRTSYDAFYQKIQEIRYANYMAINPQSMTLVELDNFLVAHISPQDRLKTYQYDLRGCLISASRVNVNREALISTNPPAFQSYNNITLTETYQYDPRELKTLTIHEALPGQTPTRECNYYDARGFERAHAGIAFTTENVLGRSLVIAPLIYYGVNAHGQKVRKLSYINGATNSTIDPQILPSPLSPDGSTDRLELKQTDTRGKICDEQDPNQRLTQSTYTLTGEVARNYWQLTDSSKSLYPESEVHIDEKRQSYDLQDRVILIDLRRDNVSQQQTALQYNAFGETMAEGPGDAKILGVQRLTLPLYLQKAKPLRKHVAIVEQKPRFFTEYVTEIDNESEFKALRVSRPEAVNILFALGEDKQVRQILIAELYERLKYFRNAPNTELDPTQFMEENLRWKLLQDYENNIHEETEESVTIKAIRTLSSKRLFKAYIDSYCVKGRQGLSLGVASMRYIAASKRLQLNLWRLKPATGQLELVADAHRVHNPTEVIDILPRGGGCHFLVAELSEGEAITAPQTSAPTPEKSTTQWPLYRTMDQVGRLINTNDHKCCEILFYDLRGAQTAELTSPTMDLSIIEQSNFPSLLAKPYTDIEKTQLIRDPAKRLLAQILPDYTLGTALQPQFKNTAKQRRRLFYPDVFKDNVLALADTLGFTTEYQYNDLDQEIQQKDPPVTVVDPDGSEIENFQGITTTHRNVDGVVIGVTLPVGNSQVYILNEQNKRTQWILGDGTVYMRYRRDGFNRAITLIDSRSQPTHRVYDPINMIQQIVPNNDPLNNRAEPLRSEIGYNEKNQRVLSEDPAGNQTHYRFTITGDIAERINPLGDSVSTTWDRNHQKLHELWESNRTQVWTPDPILGYFSIMNNYKDLGGAEYTYQYDWKLQQIACQSQGGERGNTAILTVTYDSSKQKDIYGLDTSHPVFDQDLQMTYDAGRLIQVNDGHGYRTVMNYDSEDRLVFKQIYGASQTDPLRTIISTLDALGREINFSDTRFNGLIYYDRNGNRRRRYGVVGFQTDDNWYNYDGADRPIAVDCGLSGGAYQLIKSSSLFIHYKEGVRYQETVQNGERTIEYWDNGDISRVTDSSDHSATTYHYDPSGYRWYSVTSKNNGASSNNMNIDCNADLFQTYQAVGSSGNDDGSDGKDETTLQPDKDNNIRNQSTIHYPSDGSDIISYDLDFKYVFFEDTYQLGEVSGQTSDEYGQNYTEALMYYDGNGTLNGKVGADNDDKDTDGKLSVYNLTTYDGLVIEKYQFPTDPSKDITTTTEYYFYDIHNNYLSSYTLTSATVAGKRGEADSDSAIRMRFEGIKNSGRWGHCDLDLQPRTPRQRSRFNALLSVVQPVTKVKLHETHPQRLYANSSDRDNSDDNHNSQDDGEFIQSINHIDLLTVPDKYTVKPGDTFSSIAQSQYGDTSFAQMIAIKNNYPSVNDQPSVCSTLTLPQYIPMSNKYNNNLPYTTFQNAIYGNLYPPLIFVQPPKKKQDCTETLILVACAVTAIVTAETVVGPAISASVAAGVLATQAIQVAILAASLDASLQGVAVGIGALKHFSVESVIETGVSAGMFYGVGGVTGPDSSTWMSIAGQTAAAGASDLSSQLIEMSMGIRKRLDINQTLYSMATAAVDAALTGGMNPAYGALKITNRAVVNLIDDFVDSYVNAYLGSAIMGGKPDLENALGQALGSFIGQEVSSWLAPNPRIKEQKDQAARDYIKSRGDAVQLNYGDLVNALGIHDLDWKDYANSLTSDDIQTVGTNQLPASSGQQLNSSVAQPNSYVANNTLARQAIGQMLTAMESGYYPTQNFQNLWSPLWANNASSLNLGSNNNNILQTHKGWYTEEQSWMGNLIAGGENKLSQWIYQNQNNWFGQLSYKSLPYLGSAAQGAYYGFVAASLLNGATELKWMAMGAADIFKTGATVGWENLTDYTFNLMNKTFGFDVGDVSWLNNTSMRIYNNIIDSTVANQSAKLFSIHTYNELAWTLDVSTDVNTAVFWSGRGNQELAQMYAAQTGRTVLEWTPGGKYLEFLGLDQIYPYKQAVKPWEILSLRYAQGASGDVYAFVEGASSGGVFNRVEYPALQSNINVTIQYPQVESIKNVISEMVGP